MSRIESDLLRGLALIEDATQPKGNRREKEDAVKNREMCRGCRDDYYNANREGGCWSFGGARVVKRVQVGTWEPPPYAKERAKRCLSCYSPNGYSMLKLDDSRVVPRSKCEAWKARVAGA
jgi:hypothetical protein